MARSTPMALFSRKKADVPPEVIDLREPEPQPPTLRWGSPTPCPSCEGRGYLDHIDPFKNIMFMHCTECGHRYELAKAEIGADDESDAFTL
jgi:hypothetical protein